MSSYHNADATRPAAKAVAVTPSDATTLPVTRGLYVGTLGDVVVDMADQGTDITFTNVANGTFMPIQVTKVKAATSASDILALY